MSAAENFDQELLLLEYIKADTAQGKIDAFDRVLAEPFTGRHPNIDAILSYANDLDAVKNIGIMSDAELMEALRELLGEEALEFMQKPPSRAFKTIDDILNRLFLERTKKVLPDDSQHRGAAEEIFGQGIWKSVEDGSAAQNIWLQVYADMLKHRGFLVTKYVDESAMANTQMNPVSRIEYRAFARISELTDSFYIKWNRDAGRILSTDQRRASGFIDEFATIIQNSAGEPVEVKWHEAYPEPNELSKAYIALADELLREAARNPRDSRLQKISSKKVPYYTAVGRAWSSSSKEDCRIADSLLSGQADGEKEPVHIHTIEIGYGRDRLQRVPEASLRYPDVDWESINDRALKTRATMASMLERFFGQHDGFSTEARDTQHLVSKSVFQARHFMGSGSEMNFKPAGQILPNESESRLQGGLDISVDPANLLKRIVLIQEMYRLIFKLDLPEQNIVENSGGYTASHEFGHVIGITPTTDERLEESLQKPYIEEWKATIGGMIFNEYMPYLSQQDGVDLEVLRKSITWHLALCPRYTSMRNEPSAHNYARKSFLIAKVAEDIGLLYRQNDNWAIDLSKERVLDFYETLLSQYRRVLQIYDGGTTDDLRTFLEENLRSTPFLEDMAAKVDAHFGRTSQPSVSDICKLPELISRASPE